MKDDPAFAISFCSVCEEITMSVESSLKEYSKKEATERMQDST
jgi:hypothetical protein